MCKSSNYLHAFTTLSYTLLYHIMNQNHCIWSTHNLVAAHTEKSNKLIPNLNQFPILFWPLITSSAPIFPNFIQTTTFWLLLFTFCPKSTPIWPKFLVKFFLEIWLKSQTVVQKWPFYLSSRREEAFDCFLLLDNHWILRVKALTQRLQPWCVWSKSLNLWHQHLGLHLFHSFL